MLNATGAIPPRAEAWGLSRKKMKFEDDDILGVDFQLNGVTLSVNSEKLADSQDDEGISLLYLLDEELRSLLTGVFASSTFSDDKFQAYHSYQLDSSSSDHYRFALLLKAEQIESDKVFIELGVLFHLYESLVAQKEQKHRAETFNKMMREYQENAVTPSENLVSSGV